MIRVTHALSEEPQIFDTTKFGVDDAMGFLQIYSADGNVVTHVFNRDVWASVELIEGWQGGTLYGSSQVAAERSV